MIEKEKSVVGRLYKPQKASLVEALDKVIEKGAFIRGEALLSVADVNLIYVGLQVVVSSISALEGESATNYHKEPSEKDRQYIERIKKQINEIEKSIPTLMQSQDPSQAEKGLAKLVLTLVEVIRQLMEREALRRIERGSLSETEIQKVGLTFEALEKKIQQLKAVFGIKDDLNIDLGPMKLI